MSVWGKVIGGVAGFAFGGPLGALLGAAAGHAVDQSRQVSGAVSSAEARQVAFTMGVIVLSAKMAKADGHVSRDEIEAFKQVFRIPPGEMKNVGRLFDKARKDATDFEPYAEQIAMMFAHEPAVLEELICGLFYIAMADEVLHPAELDYLKKVAAIFGFDEYDFERIRAERTKGVQADPYQVLGVSSDDTDAKIKKAYYKLIREHHPDTLIAQGLPEEFIALANEKMATINAAYDRIQKSRGSS
jgi:DnaJ like chaperone protein